MALLPTVSHADSTKGAPGSIGNEVRDGHGVDAHGPALRVDL